MGDSSGTPPATPAGGRSSGAALDAAFADVAAAGRHFHVATDPAVTADPRWRPLAELYGPALAGQVAVVQDRLGTDEPRVAASILFQAVAGRVCSPILACAAVHGLVPDLDPARTYWRDKVPGPVLLAAPGAAALPAGAGAVRRVLIERHLRPLLAATRAVTPVAEGLLWGNAASALVGAATVLGRARPGDAGAGMALVRRLLAASPLRGTGDFDRRGFRRRSCCLYYRVPGGGKCGDCALL